MTNGGDGEPETGSFSFCVAAESGNTRLVWLAMPLDALANGLSGGVDFDFAEQTIRWMADSGTEALNIPSTSIPSTLLEATNTVLIFWIVTFIVLIPVGLVAIGIIRRYLRSKS